MYLSTKDIIKVCQQINLIYGRKTYYHKIGTSNIIFFDPKFRTPFKCLYASLTKIKSNNTGANVANSDNFISTMTAQTNVLKLYMDYTKLCGITYLLELLNISLVDLYSIVKKNISNQYMSELFSENLVFFETILFNYILNAIGKFIYVEDFIKKNKWCSITHDLMKSSSNNTKYNMACVSKNHFDQLYNHSEIKNKTTKNKNDLFKAINERSRLYEILFKASKDPNLNTIETQVLFYSKDLLRRIFFSNEWVCLYLLVDNLPKVNEKSIKQKSNISELEIKFISSVIEI